MSVLVYLREIVEGQNRLWSVEERLRGETVSAVEYDNRPNARWQAKNLASHHGSVVILAGPDFRPAAVAVTRRRPASSKTGAAA